MSEVPLQFMVRRGPSCRRKSSTSCQGGLSRAMRLCWLRTRPGSNHAGHAAPDDTLTLLGQGPDAALMKEAEMWYRVTSLI
jgi:hypothetical protein